MFKPEFTKEEANTLISFIDFAVKSGGLSVAEIAIQLAARINASEVKEEPVNATE